MIAAMCSRYGVPSWDSRNEYPSGASPLETLPSELLSKILSYVTLPGHEPSNQILMPTTPNTKPIKEHLCLLPTLHTSSKLYTTALPILYRDPNLSSPTTFETFARQITKSPHLGSFIRILDLTHLAPTRNITGPWSKARNPLFELLSRAPLLRELYIDQYLSSEIDSSVLDLILTRLSHLTKLNFHICNSLNFKRAFEDYLRKGRCDMNPGIKKLSLRGCGEVSEEVFVTLLSQLPRLGSLDVRGTRVTVDALKAIHNTARLQQLDISNCSNLSGKELAEFLSAHPSIQNSLIALNLAEAPESRILDEADLHALLSNLPPTITSLNLQNTKLSSSHASYLQHRWAHLENLSMGSHLRMQDLESIALSTNYDFTPLVEEDSDINIFEPSSPNSKYHPVLATMEKAVAVCKLRQRINSVTPLDPPSQIKPSSLRYLDISSMSIPEQSKIQTSVLLGGGTALEVIEISGLVMQWNEDLESVCKAVGWRVRSMGRRYCLERR